MFLSFRLKAILKSLESFYIPHPPVYENFNLNKYWQSLLPSTSYNVFGEFYSFAFVYVKTVLFTYIRASNIYIFPFSFWHANKLLLFKYCESLLNMRYWIFMFKLQYLISLKTYTRYIILSLPHEWEIFVQDFQITITINILSLNIEFLNWNSWLA